MNPYIGLLTRTKVSQEEGAWLDAFAESLAKQYGLTFSDAMGKISEVRQQMFLCRFAPSQSDAGEKHG